MNRWWLHGGRVVDPSTGEDRVRDVFIDGDVLVDVAANAASGFSRVDCSGMVVAPGFFDLYGALPDVARESRAAAAGGFTTVALTAIVDRPSIVRDLRLREQDAWCRIVIPAALTMGQQGDEIADVGLLVAGGCELVSNGITPIRSTRVLRHLLEYAGRVGRPVMLRASDPELEGQGIVRDGPRATWLGLPGVPPASEEVGIGRLAALVRLSGATVHVSHVWSRLGVDALRRARAERLPITGSTTIHHLGVDDGIIEESAYGGNARFVPVLGDDADRAALRDALGDGTLLAVATDHRPISPHLKDRELEVAAPGAVGFEVAWALTAAALGVPGAVRALTAGASLLGRNATLRAGAPADVAVVDVDRSWTVTAAGLRSSHANTPMLGRTLRGSVRRVFCAGRPGGEPVAR